MLHINKFKFGLNEDLTEFKQNDHKDCTNPLTKLTNKRTSKQNVKILATIGPKSYSERFNKENFKLYKTIQD